jgi:hypothetical protein
MLELTLLAFLFLSSLKGVEEMRLAARVTRLGEFSPMGRLITSDNLFLKITEVAIS